MEPDQNEQDLSSPDAFLATQAIEPNENTQDLSSTEAAQVMEAKQKAQEDAALQVANTLMGLQSEPNPQTLGRLYISNHRCSCALFACPVVQQTPSAYCCSHHERLSTELSDSKLPLQVCDSFLDLKHRDTLCTAALLVRSKGFKTGIPTLNDDTMFSTVPWAQPTVFDTSSCIKRDYLFFRSTKATFKVMLGTPLTLRWKANTRKTSVIEGKEMGTRSISIRQQDPSNSEEKWDAVKTRDGRYWVLHLYDYEATYLYCLSYSADPPTLPFNKIKPEEDDKPEEGDEKESPRKKKSKVSGVSLQKPETTSAIV